MRASESDLGLIFGSCYQPREWILTFSHVDVSIWRKKNTCATKCAEWRKGFPYLYAVINESPEWHLFASWSSARQAQCAYSYQSQFNRPLSQQLLASRAYELFFLSRLRSRYSSRFPSLLSLVLTTIVLVVVTKLYLEVPFVFSTLIWKFKFEI